MGLISGALLKGAGDGTASLGGSLMNIISADERAAASAAERRLLQEERLAAQKEVAEIRKSGSGGKDGPFMDEVKPDSMAEELMANRLGISVPELRALRAANKSGDTSGLGEEVPLAGPTEDGSALTGRRGISPEALAAKRQALADIQSEFLYGDKYDDVTKGRRTETGNKVGQGIIAGAMDVGKGGQTIAAIEGKGAMTEGGGTVYNEFTGDAKTTDVGKSTIRKNDADAGDSRSKAKQRDSGQDPERLKLITDLTQRERTLRTQMGKFTSDPILANDIKKGRPPADYVAMQEELKSVLAQREALQIGNVKKGGDNAGGAGPKNDRPPLGSFFKN